MAIQHLLKNIKTIIITEKAFLKNASFVFGGKIYIAILSLALTPIIARLFTPEDYGEFALYNTIVKNLVVLGTLSLPIAISTIKKSELSKVINLTITVIIASTFIFTGGLLLFNNYLDALFATSLFSKYGYLILLAFVITSTVTTLIALNNRLQKFKTTTQVGIVEATSAKILNLSGGWMALHSIGLILSDFISKVVSLLLLLKNLPKEVTITIPNFLKAKELLQEYKQFPLYIMPSQWIGTLNNNFIILAVAYLFTKNELGKLTLAIGLLSIPLHVLSNTLQPVITERLATLKENKKNRSFLKFIFSTLLLISIVVFTPITLLPSSVFTFALGSNWQGINPIITILSVYYIFLFIDQSVENGFIISNKQKQLFHLSIIELILQVTIIPATYIYDLSLVYVIILLAIARSLVSSIRVVYLWGNINSSLKK